MNAQNEAEDTGWAKALRLLFKIVLAATGIVAITTALLLYIYEGEVKQAIITGLNRHLKAEVSVHPQNIRLTILRTFPRASLEFRDVLIKEALAQKNRDTLLFARRINLHFDVADLWKGRYGIERLSLIAVIAKPRILRSGEDNYTIWQSTGTDKDEPLSFDLNLVTLEDITLRFRNEQKKILADLHVNQLGLSGNFRKGDLSLRSDAFLHINNISESGNTLLNDKDIRYRFRLKKVTDVFDLSDVEFSINDLKMDGSGSLTYRDTLSRLELAFQSESTDLRQAASLLPAALKTRLADYEFDAQTDVSGKFTWLGPRTYSLDASMKVRDGIVRYLPGKIGIEKVDIDAGIIYSASQSALNVQKAGFELMGGAVTGSLSLKNFTDPVIALRLNSNARLEDIHRFCPIDTVETVSGALEVDLTLSGDIDNIRELQFGDKAQIDLLASGKELDIKFKGDSRNFIVDNFDVHTDGKVAELDNLVLRRGSSDLTISGTMPGLLRWISDRSRPVVIRGEVTSHKFDLADFMSDTESQISGEFEIPANLHLSLEAGADEFRFGKFIAENVEGMVEIKNRKAMLSDMSFETMGGEAVVNALADNSRDAVSLTLDAEVNDIDVSALFSQMNNFGQTVLREDHLRGTASATVEFSGRWSNRFVCDQSSIQSGCDLRIDGGELANFQPLLSLSKFLNIEDLKRVRFSELNAQVSIADRRITVKRTAVQNNALNIDFSGAHSFDNNIDYHFRFLFEELMARRMKNPPEFEEKIGSRRMVFISMSGNIDDPVISYDRKGLKEKVKEDIRAEKQNVRQILHEEFGLFKSDSVPKRKLADQSAFQFETSAPPPKKAKLVKKKEAEEDF